MLGYSDKQALTLLNLPAHLQKTYRVLLDHGEACAEDVAAITHRARAVESNYLNQLLNMKIVTMRRVRRYAMFKDAAELKTK